MNWQPIETAPKGQGEMFLVYDGVGVWKAWNEEYAVICGYEVDGCELPHGDFPPRYWMPLPPAPKEGE